MQRCLLRIVPAVLAGWLLVLCSGVVQRAYADDQVAFRIGDAEITESSGLARDTGRNIYWTVNDSASKPTVYGLDSSGQVVGSMSFRGDVHDLEAVAVSNGRVYVADIGDNQADRDFVTVYFFDNATLSGQTIPYGAYDFRYPDGPRDAETLIVDDQGRLYIVSKEAKAGVYAAPVQPSRRGVNELTRVGDAPAYVTDGVMLPDHRIALRTYVSVQVLDAASYDVVARAATPFQPQGESITRSLDGQSLLIGTEGKNSAVLSVPVPDSLAKTPDGTATPPPSSTPTPSTSSSGSATPAPETSDDQASSGPDKSRGGTLLALGLAAVVALGAGVVVAVSRSSSTG